MVGGLNTLPKYTQYLLRGSKSKRKFGMLRLSRAKVTSFQATSASSGYGGRESRLAPFNRKRLEGRSCIVL